jgi:hypothetical protein
MAEHRKQNGRFKPGHPGFKPKGAVSEFQKITRQQLGDFLISKLDDLPAVYSKLSAKEKARLLLSCAEYFLPKQKEINLEYQFPDLTQFTQAEVTQFLNSISVKPEEDQR